MGWKTLTHNGVYTYPQYVPSIKSKITYKNKKLSIHPQLEEALGLYGKIKSTDKIFKKNFLKSIRHLLPLECSKIENLHEIKFPTIKIEKRISVDPSKFTVFINGKEEKLDRCCADPSYIFVGRGNHILRGTFKPAVKQSDIVLNCSKSCKISGKWKGIVCNKNVDWIACWKDPLFRKYKYIYPHSSSILKSKQAVQKFDFAKKVKSKLTCIRNKYMKDIESNSEQTKQHAIAVYLIDKLLIRCGTETDDYDTFGCTTLECRHVNVKRNTLMFNFVGKDSVVFKKSLVCSSPIIVQYFSNLSKQCATHAVFDKISGASLNNYLNNIVPNLTAKVFRTCHASNCLQKYLKDSTTVEQFKSANAKVADICNHTNLSTSKGNYVDPRIIVAFSKRSGVNLSKLLSPALVTKYAWAENTNAHYKF